MATRTKPVPRQRIFEARYEHGYRYLDRCGELILILEGALGDVTGQLWFPQEMVPTGARLVCPELDITIVFHSERLIVDRNPIGEVECDFTELAATALATIKGRLDLRKWMRFGSRQVNVIGTDSIEEAEQLSVKFAPVADWQNTESGDATLQPRDHQITSTFELADRKKGARVRTGPYHQVSAPLQLDPRLKSPPHLLPEGQHEVLLDQLRRAKQREKAPEAGLLIDIDYYWVGPSEDATVRGFLQEAKRESERLETAYLTRREQR